MKQRKDVRITFRLTPEQYESIETKAKAAQMPVGAYVRTAALRHRVVVVDGLKEIARELKGIGRNINQMTTLAHMGKISDAYLRETLETLGNIYHQLQRLADQETR